MPHRDVTIDVTATSSKPKRRYSMTEKARAQRQAAPLRHGGRAQSGAGGVVATTAPGAGLTRAEQREFARIAAALERASTTGDRTALMPVVTRIQARLLGLVTVEVEHLLREGTTLVERIPTGKQRKTGAIDQHGQPVLEEVTLERRTTNPRARALVDLLKVAGLDASSWGTTPKSATVTPGADNDIDRHWAWQRGILDRTGEPGEGAGPSGSSDDGDDGGSTN